MFSEKSSLTTHPTALLCTPRSALSHHPLFLSWCVCVCWVTSVMSNSLRPYGLQPAKLLCPWDSPGKNTRVGCHALLQGDIPDPGIEPMSLMFPALAHRFLTWEASLDTSSESILCTGLNVYGWRTHSRTHSLPEYRIYVLTAVTAAPTTVTRTQKVSMAWMNACLCSLTKNSSRNSPVLFKTETTEQIINEWVQLPL